jgi:hypothetical protein
MTHSRKPYPEPKPAFEVGIGHYDHHWFVGIRPPISSELLDAVGENAVKGWYVEEFDGEITGATLLRKSTSATEKVAATAAIALTIGLSRETGKSAVYYPAPVAMAFNTAPFPQLQPDTLVSA